MVKAHGYGAVANVFGEFKLFNLYYTPSNIQYGTCVFAAQTDVTAVVIVLIASMQTMSRIYR